MARVLITGGSGYIGSHLAIALHRDHEVLSLDCRRPRLRLCAHELADLRDRSAIRKVIDQFKPETIFHLAAARQARESMLFPHHYNASNVLATENLLQAITDERTSLIFASSCSVFGNQDDVVDDTPFNPISPYAETKILGEELIGKYMNPENYLVLRLFNIVGSWQPQLMDTTGDALMRNYRAAIMSGHSLPIYGNTFNTPDGTAVREYMHVGDVVELFAKAASIHVRDLSTQPIRNVSGGAKLSVKQIADAVNTAANRSNDSVIYLAERPGDPARITSGASEGFGNWRPRRSIRRALSSEINWLLNRAMTEKRHGQY